MTDKFYNWEEQKNSFRLETKKSLHGLFNAGLRFNPGLISNLNSVLNVYKKQISVNSNNLYNLTYVCSTITVLLKKRNRNAALNLTPGW